jgi:hypothetical protein
VPQTSSKALKRCVPARSQAPYHRSDPCRGHRPAGGSVDPQKTDQAGARSDLARIEARITELAGNGGDKGDEAEASRDGAVDVARHEEIARLRAEWNTAYWRSFPS